MIAIGDAQLLDLLVEIFMSLIPIFVLMFFIGLIVWFLPLKYNPLVYDLDKCFPGLREALIVEVRKKEEEEQNE